MNYYQKYSKYKTKYLNLKSQIGGQISDQVPSKSIYDANNEFTIILFENLDQASNIFSPLSISFALSLIHLAALGNTNNQLTTLLGTKYSVDDLKRLYGQFNNKVIKINNALIINNKIKINKEYLQMINGLTYIIIENFDNAKLISHEVNSHIDNNTDGMIKNVISPDNITNNIMFVLINTIYFKASWQHKFNPQLTTKMEFHKTKSNMVDMMHQIGYFNYYENNSVQLVEMPYDERNYMMGIILPQKYLEENGLDYSINNIPQFSKQEIAELINNLEYTKVDLYIPKFTQRKKYDMVPVLKKMGLTDIFRPDAELDIIAKNAYISKIIHEAVIIVDELGTEAAATTVMVSKENVALPDNLNPKLFKADHAFIYYIRHIPSNLFLFYGDYQGNKY
jgi:serine protease inhibitor